MQEHKNKKLSLESLEKESISERLRVLIGSRTVRAAAEEWGLPFSTLNNYLTRGTEPSLNVALRIAKIENVPVEWLAEGIIFVEEVHRGSSVENLQNRLIEEGYEGVSLAFTGTPATSIDGAISSAWSLIFDSLDAEERYELVHLFFRIGARGVLQNLKGLEANDKTWSNLSESEKERLIRLHEQLKKGPPEDDSSVAEADLSSKNQKAG
ncbi:hypothetical protein [Citrobacter sp. Igbk 14]|uniref:hypothetical protein n=1 Tax=Citrobacter sp. Igbk 14 TaxID=2963960 RepID=UPI0023043E5A|nr:hypothetical protein [Citrobacter sp. Igbk 14]MDA8510946.1 helix-turn-helix domain containing protein [Citrobacter sp. Igbk 14]